MYAFAIFVCSPLKHEKCDLIKVWLWNQNIRIHVCIIMHIITTITTTTTIIIITILTNDKNSNN